MSWYLVVTRERPSITISEHPTLDGAGNKIFRERAFDIWTVRAFDGGRRAGSPLRALNHSEKLALERILYPSLYD